MNNKSLYQPLISYQPEELTKSEGISFHQFISLLRKEEDFFGPDQHKTKLMFSRLRKIFYDKWGWDSELIRKAKNIEGRYEVVIVDDTPQNPEDKRKKGSKIDTSNYGIIYKHRVIRIKEGDWMNPLDAGKTPEIYSNDNQDVKLPDGIYCDLGHVLAGIDASNNFAPVTPLPDWLMWARFIIPSVDSNVDVVTWLGDIASSSGEFLFQHLRKKRALTTEEKQKIINVYATASDMLGDIDPYVIANYYNTTITEGERVTDILSDYYTKNSEIRSKRCYLFCKAVGLKEWDGQNFSNEKKWLKYYKNQLRNNITFQVFSLTNQKLKSIWLPLFVWFRFYDKVLEMDKLLIIFLDALKNEMINENKTN